jgi:hydrogenase maturation protein HypF
VRGLVQGVGFRPTVWRLAQDCGIAGEVWNDAQGVMIQAWGMPAALDEFIHRLRENPPPLARIDAVECAPLRDAPYHSSFDIVASRAGLAQTSVVPDAATCVLCMAETLSASDRRHRYPFTNCTHCGPRFSIASAIPYDRANTSMRRFALCHDCVAEYEDPADRRFHAQPLACPRLRPDNLTGAAGRRAYAGYGRCGGGCCPATAQWRDYRRKGYRRVSSRLRCLQCRDRRTVA